MQKINLLALGALVASLTLGVASSSSAADAEVNYQPLKLSAEAGTLGLGGSLSWRFTDHFGVRGGVNYFGYSRDGDNIEGVSYNSKLRLLSAPLGVDIYPWENHSIHFTVGALINKNRLKGNSPSTGAGTFVELNGNQIDSGAVGNLSMESKQKIFSPFLSIGGDFNLNHAKTLSLGYEVGVAYTGSPKVTLTRDGGASPAIDTQLEAERQQLEDKAKDYKFYPIIKVSLSYAF